MTEKPVDAEPMGCRNIATGCLSFAVVFAIGLFLIPIEIPPHVDQMPRDEVYNAIARDSAIFGYALQRAAISAAVALFAAFVMMRVSKRLK